VSRRDGVEGRTAERARSLNNPLYAVEGASAFAGCSLLRSDAHNVAFDAIKRAEQGDELVVRLHEYEYTGARGTVTLTGDCPIASWQECDLMERPVGDIRANGEPLTFELAPYEIKTFLIRMS